MAWLVARLLSYSELRPVVAELLKI
jgi:hypothetical protein